MDKNFVSKRKMWYKTAKANKEPFKINDLGAGSKKMNATRSVSQLVKTASSNGIYGSVLWKIAHHYKPQFVLELGTSIGSGIIHLKGGNPDAHIVTIEGCKETLRRAYQQFDFWGLSKITAIQSSFDDFLELPPIGEYDLVFIDGNHTSEPTKKAIEKILPYTNNNTLFILDDIRWNDDMWNMWNELIQDERFHVTIDLGRMGLLWIRSEQAKEHFIIRPWILKTKLL